MSDNNSQGIEKRSGVRLSNNPPPPSPPKK